MEKLIGKKVKVIELNHPHVGHEGIVLRVQEFKGIEGKALVIDRSNGHSFCVFDINGVEEVK